MLNESHNTQCLGSVVPLAILTLCALNLQPFHISIGSQGTSIWGETLDEDFELLCCEGYLVTVGGVRSILLPFTWLGWGRRNFKCNILTKHREFWNKLLFASAISDHSGNVILSHKKWKICPNTVISKCWPLILGVRGGSIRNMALYLLSCQWAKSRRLTSVWIFTHVTQPGSFTVFTTAFPWLQSTPQQKKISRLNQAANI